MWMSVNNNTLKNLLPVLQWGARYNREIFSRDLVASIIITTVMIPQAMAYALLAGLPPQTGLYACILPLLAYGVFGGSGSLSVGPFAITSMMTATALKAAFAGVTVTEADYLLGAAVLALISGVFLVGFGLLRLGFLANFISMPVVSGFISASALMIATSQLGNLLGFQVEGGTIFEKVYYACTHLEEFHVLTFGLAIASLAFLFWIPRLLLAGLQRLGMSSTWATLASKLAPIFAMILAGILVSQLGLDAKGVAIIGTVPEGLPVIQFPSVINPESGDWLWEREVWGKLVVSGILISLIGYVSSLSTAQAFAAKKRQRIEPSQEAIGLGVANIGAGVSGGFPVAAGLSRSALLFNAGSETPAAGIISGISVALATLYLTPWLTYLPTVILAAMIVLAVLSLVDLDVIKRCWHYNKQDFSALVLTMAIALLAGAEAGLISGVVLSIILLLYRASQPHIAVLGLVPGTEHFRNIQRHKVITHPQLIMVRVDSALFFANGRYLEDQINKIVALYPGARHLVLACSSVSFIDASALESLYLINDRLNKAGIKFHLSEVIGPVTDRLARSDWSGGLQVHQYLSNYQAWTDIIGESKVRVEKGSKL